MFEKSFSKSSITQNFILIEISIGKTIWKRKKCRKKNKFKIRVRVLIFQYYTVVLKNQKNYSVKNTENIVSKIQKIVY